jgi:hypothetical protein
VLRGSPILAEEQEIHMYVALLRLHEYIFIFILSKLINK